MENNNGADLEVTKKERGRKGVCTMYGPWALINGIITSFK
jgi:hypothetical protein